MSTGLGLMQRAIIAALRPAREAHEAGTLSYRGGADMPNAFGRAFADRDEYPRPPARIRQHRKYFVLPAEIYDLRATLAYLADQAGKRHPIGNGHDADPAFRAAFSRAVRTLIQRRVLVNADPGYSSEVRLVRFTSNESAAPDV